MRLQPDQSPSRISRCGSVCAHRAQDSIEQKPWQQWECRCAGVLGWKGSAGPGESSGGSEEEGRRMRQHHSGTTTKNQDGVCLTTVRRLRQETAKKEELAVQQPRRTAPPFPDVRPSACSSRAKGFAGHATGHFHARRPKKTLPGHARPPLRVRQGLPRGKTKPPALHSAGGFPINY